jgi:NAD-dependent DNA ligase
MFRQPKLLIPFHSLLTNQLRKSLFLNYQEPLPKLKKIRTQQALWRFCSDLEGRVIVEKKLDGISCYLVYYRGQLIKANTKNGLNILRIIKRIGSIPNQVDRFFTGGVRGELYMTKKGFELYNGERKRERLKAHKSSITAIMSLIKSNNSFNQKCIEFHGFFINGWVHLETQMDTIKMLERLGINRRKEKFFGAFNLPNDFISLCRYVENIQLRKDEFDSNIDGLVLKADVLSIQRTTKGMVAFKYDFTNDKTNPSEKVNFMEL